MSSQRSSSPSSRLRAFVAAALLCAVLTGCKTEIYQGLTEPQVNAMVALLLKNGIDGEKIADKKGYTLSVKDDQVAVALDLLRENSLPSPQYETMGEVFAAKGMISSATEEQARLTYALGQELSATLSQIDGVLTARVHVVLAHEDLATGRTTPASAAVFIRYNPTSQAPGLVADIQRLAANAVPGLDAKNVSVMLVPVRDNVTVPLLTQEASGSFFSRWWPAALGLIVVLGAAAGVLYRRWRAKKAAAPKAANEASA